MPNHFFSQNGLTACCTDTSITLFWDKPAAAGAVETYTVLLDDAAAAHTQKTHCTLENLRPETIYSLFVQWRSGSIGELTIRTTPTKRCLDVTASPYSAVGDGKAMNTAALQKPSTTAASVNKSIFRQVFTAQAHCVCTAIWNFTLKKELCCKAQQTQRIICRAFPAALRALRWSATAAC